LGSELIKNAVVPFEEVEEQESEKRDDHPRVSECFSVTEAVLPVVKLYGFKKGDVMQPNQLREMIIQYGTEKVGEEFIQNSNFCLESADR
jgi:hypothetical protein